MQCINGPLPVVRDRVFHFKGPQARIYPETGKGLARFTQLEQTHITRSLLKIESANNQKNLE
jgi:hypothetical protein